MQGLIGRLSLVFLFVFDLFPGYGQVNIDSLFNTLTEYQRVGLLFISGNEAGDHIGFNILNSTKKKDKDISGCLIDVSGGLDDNLPVPFPSGNVFGAVEDKELVNRMMITSGRYYYASGYSGILYKYNGNRNSDGCLYRLITFSDGCSIKRDVALFDGLSLSKYIADVNVSFEELLAKGCLFFSDDTEKSINKILRAIDNRILNAETVEKHAKEVLQLRHSRITGDDEGGVKALKNEMLKLRWDVWLKTFSIIQKRRDINVEHTFMPVNTSYGLIDLTGKFAKAKSRYNDPEYILSGLSYTDTLPDAGQVVLVASENNTFPDSILTKLRDEHLLKLIYFGDPDSFMTIWKEKMQYFNKIFYSPGFFDGIDFLIDQVMFGGVAVTATMPFYDELTKKGFGSVNYDKLRIGYGFPELTGMQRDTLKKIDSVLNVVIKKKMAPGGQVLIAKDGYVVYDKYFGYTTYSKKVKVDAEKIYDLASLTKIVASVPIVMKLYDEGKIGIDDSIKRYLPQTDTLETGDITIKQLLLHEAGLPSYIPFHFDYVDSTSFRGSMYSGIYSRKYSVKLDKYFFFNKNVKYKRNVFRHRGDTLFSTRISDNLYMNHYYRDSLFNRVYKIKLNKDKEYLYSDVGYYFIQSIIEEITDKSVDELFRHWFTEPLGAHRLSYLPLKYFPVKDIVPTGKDMVFRKEMLHGYANDAGAAMLGGVACHAGLFGNTTSLSKFAQMLLNRGLYGGDTFIEPETVDMFTSRQNDENRRGLGFDKPETDPEKESPVSLYASPSSYGHSGYTGTFMWIDPEYDLIYIFLSNRIYPHNYNKKLIKENIRTHIQDIIYRSFLPADKISEQIK